MNYERQEIDSGDTFTIGESTWYCKERNTNNMWNCLALPINNPGPPKWFDKQEMIEAVKA